MPYPMLVFLLFMAVAWFTYLAVESHFPPIRIPRDFLIRKLDPRDRQGNKTGEAVLGGFGRSVGYLLGCPWCTSAYVSAAVIYVTQTWTSVPLPYLVWAGACMFTGMLSDARGWGEEKYKLNRARVFQEHDRIKSSGVQLPPQWEE